MIKHFVYKCHRKLNNVNHKVYIMITVTTDLPQASTLAVRPHLALFLRSALRCSALDTHCVYSSSKDDVSLIHVDNFIKQRKILF